MPKPVPIYRSADQTCQADSCLPLVQAAAARQVRLEALAHGHYPGKRLSPEALTGIKTVGYWHAEDDQQWGLPWHYNEGVELTFVERGMLDFAVDDHAYSLQPGDVTVTRPWQRHRVGSPHVGAGRLHWVIIDVGVRRPHQNWKWPKWLLLTEKDLDELTNIMRHNEQPVWRGSPQLGHCFEAIARAVEADRGGSNVSRLAVRVNDLLLLLLDMLRNEKVRLDESLSSSRRTVQLFLADLRAHPEHLALEWDVGEMARSCGLGVTQFVHHVKSLTSMTPAHYLSHCRLDLAAEFLRQHPERTVTDVALECGFSSGQYFATLFARRFRCAPSEFRVQDLSLKKFERHPA